MALTLANADAALKEWYLPAIRYQLNNDTPILNIIGQRTVDIEGRRAVLSLRLGRNFGIGARADGGTLPNAGNQQYAEERVPLRYNYGVGQITGPTIEQTGSDRGSFIRAVSSETEGVTDDLKRDFNRQIWGTSNGVIAQCGVSGPSTTIALNAVTPDSAVRQFFIGQRIDVGTVAQLGAGVGGKVYGAAISAIVTTPGAATLTIDSSITVAATDFISMAGSGGISPQKELTGLQSIVAASGLLFNVDPASQPVWASRVDANGGTPRAISENLMGRNMQLVQIACGEWLTHYIGSDGVHRAYANLLMAQKRYPNARELPGGYTALDFAAAGPIIPVIYDRDCPSGVTATPQTVGGNLFGLNAKHLYMGSASDWAFMNRDGAVLSRTGTTDAYNFVLYRYAETFTDKRSAHVRISDLLEA
jgi:hypothetical protein